jgi:hypothetical protein
VRAATNRQGKARGFPPKKFRIFLPALIWQYSGKSAKNGQKMLPKCAKNEAIFDMWQRALKSQNEKNLPAGPQISLAPLLVEDKYLPHKSCCEHFHQSSRQLRMIQAYENVSSLRNP